MSLLLRTLTLICLVLLFIFCVSNRDPMVVRFLSWESPELPVFLLLVFAFLAGAMLALLSQSLRGVARRRQPTEPRPRKLSRREKRALERQAQSDATTETDTDSDAGADEPVAQTDDQSAPTERNEETD